VALSERSRSVLYQGLITIVEDEQAVQEMMSYFPARDVEEPVTKELLRAEMSDLRAGLRGEMSDLRAELRGEMSDLRAELRGEMSDLRAELHREMSDLRAELHREIGKLRDDLRGEIHRATRWNIAAMVSIAAVLVAAIRL
jgi:hypothetical protein